MPDLLEVQRWGHLPHVLLSAALVLLLAWFSWRLVERPSMNGAKRLIAKIRSRSPGTAAA